MTSAEQKAAATDLPLADRLKLYWVEYVWVIAFSCQAVLNVFLPREDKASPFREIYRGWHYSTGVILTIFSVWVLIRLWKKRAAPVNVNMHAGANRWSFTLAFITAAMLCIPAIFGIFSAWGQGLELYLGPIGIPSLMGEDRAVWMFAGYFHAAIGVSVLVLSAIALLSSIYFLFRYGQGLFAAFPNGLGLLTLINAISAVYGGSTFSSPEPGPRAIAIFLSICLLIWGAARLLKRQPSKTPGVFHGKAGLGVIASIVIICMAATGIYGPYAMFRVSPFQSGATVKAPEGVTSHGDPEIVVEIFAETDLERDVRKVNYKWCTFCHTVNKGGKHLAGPNLYGIFGRKVGTVPNFTYSENFAAHGTAGKVWDDATMDALIADPDAFAPGTTMIVSSGNEQDPARRAALINILKKETMGNAVKEVPAP